jgi:hypothetical protein
VNNIRFGVIALSLASLSPLLQAQWAEAVVNYSLVVYNPAKSLAGDRDLNGGGGSFAYDFATYFGVKAEFEGYTSTTLTFHLPPTVGSGAAGGTFNTQGNMFTYLFGPQFNLITGRARIFGETLFGGASTNAYANLFHAAHVTGLSASNNGFAMAFGGGVDIPLSKHMALRPAQFDYFLTRYEWKTLGINNQSNFRYQAGLLYAFGQD